MSEFKTQAARPPFSPFVKRRNYLKRELKALEDKRTLAKMKKISAPNDKEQMGDV